MQIAQTEQKAQYEVVAVLCVLALFTQENLYWIAALLLAVIDIPDFTGWFVRMAGWTERVAAKERTSSSASRSPEVRQEPRSSPCTDTEQHGKAHRQQITHNLATTLRHAIPMAGSVEAVDRRSKPPSAEPARRSLMRHFEVGVPAHRATRRTHQ
jgi:hypothetical protein